MKRRNQKSRNSSLTSPGWCVRRVSTTRVGDTCAAVQDDQYADLVDGLRELGLSGITPAEVTAAVKMIYPNGVAAEPEGAVLRAVFLRIKRQFSAGNVG